MTSNVITSERFAQALKAAGIVTDLNRVSRITIELNSGQPVRIYVERFGDQRLEELAGELAGAEVIDTHGT